ncbi:MAG: hypothetical protein NTY02_02410, partial [Acidobacteria bacterium]|nr:hypothetical protein [Acidobacteriota bacterium]
AATSPLSGMTTTERRRATAITLSHRPDPTQQSVVSGPSPTFIFEATSKSKTAGGRIGVQRGDLLLDLTLQGVIDSDTHEAVFADLDGLRNKSTAELGVSWTHWSERDPKAVLDQVCDEYRAMAGGAMRGACSSVELRAATLADGTTLADRVRVLLPKRLLLTGVSYAFGPEQFRFVPAAGAGTERLNRTNWSVSAHAGVVTRGTLAFGARYTHEVVYTSGDTRQICTPSGSSGILQCAEKVVGAPTRGEHEIAAVELRSFIGQRFAMNPRLSANLSTGTVGFDLPLYFLQKPDGGLAGGVSLGWRYSSQDGGTFEITAFVGEVFALIVKEP